MSLELDCVSVSFSDGPDRVHALRDVSLTVRPGELTMVTGPSGAGKSTLLAVAGLLLTPGSGAVRIAGTDTAPLNERARALLRRRHLAFVFQNASLMPSLTAVEQLQLVAHIRGIRPGKTAEQARSLLSCIGLADRASHRPHELSGGERQRVGIARALMASPAVLLADEPTAALDKHQSRAIFSLLAEETRAKELATLAVTHDVDHLDMADRVVHLTEGIIETVSSPDGR